MKAARPGGSESHLRASAECAWARGAGGRSVPAALGRPQGSPPSVPLRPPSSLAGSPASFRAPSRDPRDPTAQAAARQDSGGQRRPRAGADDGRARGTASLPHWPPTDTRQPAAPRPAPGRPRWYTPKGPESLRVRGESGVSFQGAGERAGRGGRRRRGWCAFGAGPVRTALRTLRCLSLCKTRGEAGCSWGGGSGRNAAEDSEAERETGRKCVRGGFRCAGDRWRFAPCSLPAGGRCLHRSRNHIPCKETRIVRYAVEKLLPQI